jgi:Beta-ketoacyl synthase, N-terminal domain
MMELAVCGIGVCASGLTNWAQSAAILAGAAPYASGATPAGAPEGLPGTERRRVNETSRLACLAAADALHEYPADDRASIPTVFVSSDGDGAVLAHMLETLAQRPIVVSPTAFHNSVYNAPAGYWSIAARSTAPSTTICADEASFAVGLTEAYAQVRTMQRPVLVVAVDAPFPEAIRALGASAAAFACALALDVSREDGAGPRLARWAIGGHAMPVEPCDDALASAFAGNAAAAAVPLLRALARDEPARVALPYLDGSVLELDVTP